MNVALDAVTVSVICVFLFFRWFEPVHAEAVLLHLLTPLSRSVSISAPLLTFLSSSVKQTRKLTHTRTHTHSLDVNNNDVTDGGTPRPRQTQGTPNERHVPFRSIYLLVELFLGRFPRLF